MNTSESTLDGAAEPAAPERPVEAGTSQSLLAQQRLRELILSGELPPGMRILEVPLSERLGVSRTPVRTALVRLEQEGLLEGLPNGGYRVRHFSEHDVRDAIELRGTVEGLAARLAAERGAPAELLAEAREQLHAIDGALAAATFGAAEFAAYAAHNERFHTLLSDLPGSEVIRREVERARSLPFASPSAFLGVQLSQPGVREMLIVAQQQHHAVLEAIGLREGTRAEALMREHARLARRNLERALVDHAGWRLVPGAALLRRPDA